MLARHLEHYLIPFSKSRPPPWIINHHHPKTGVAWLEVKSQTPYKDIQQQLASSKQPTLLKFKQLDHHFAGLKPILTTAQQQKQLQHSIIRQSRFQHDQVAMVARVLQLNDGIALVGTRP